MYINDSLETEMIDGGYNYGTGGIPNMTDYRDYANDYLRRNKWFGFTQKGCTVVRGVIILNEQF